MVPKEAIKDLPSPKCFHTSYPQLDRSTHYWRDLLDQLDLPPKSNDEGSMGMIHSGLAWDYQPRSLNSDCSGRFDSQSLPINPHFSAYPRCRQCYILPPSPTSGECLSDERARLSNWRSTFTSHRLHGTIHVVSHLPITDLEPNADRGIRHAVF